MAKKKLEEFDLGADEQPAADKINKSLQVIDEDLQLKKATEEESKTKEKISKQVNFRMPEATYEKYDKMFGSKGVSFSRAIRMWLDYGYNSIQNGTLDMSESGVREVILNRLK